MQYFTKSIIITESQIKPLLKGIILEDRESKNQHKARVYLRNNGISEDRAKQVLDAIRHDIPNARLAQCKFLVGICRYFLNKELDIMKMNGILPFIASDAHVNEYDSDFNGLSFENLYNQFKTIKDKSSEESRKQSYNKTNLQRNPDYTIYKIPSFEEASKFSNYTSWCVTRNNELYDRYTNNEMGIFYFCVKKGFESLEKPTNKSGNPLDEYGLSMIAISVDEKGDLNTCTSRWNHDNNGNDHIMTKDQIEDLLGVNFYETFKPRYTTKEELEKFNREKDEKVRNIIKKVIQSDEFEEYGYYEYGEYENNEGDVDYECIKKVELLNGDIKYIVQSKLYDYKYKIFNSDLSFFTNEKFYEVRVLNRKNGFLIYYEDNSFNILLLNGSLLFEHNAYRIIDYKNFICIIMTEDSDCEIYDLNLNKITDETFDNVNSIRKNADFIKIKKNSKWNVMDINGNILLNKNYDKIYDVKNFKGYLFFSVKDGGKRNVVNRLGQKLFDEDVREIFLENDSISYPLNGFIWNIKDIPYEEAIKRMH